MFSSEPSVFFPWCRRDQVSHPYKATKFWFCIFQTLSILERRQENKGSKQNGSKHSPSLICSFPRGCNFDLLLQLSDIWTSQRFRRIYEPLLVILPAVLWRGSINIYKILFCFYFWTNLLTNS
jgi:hypothetical protein